MEPENVSDYNKREYWDQRYSKEPTFDWFSSVYNDSVDLLAKVVEGHTTASDCDVIRVLHLGAGNSNLCRDLLTQCTPFLGNKKLLQVAVDYSSVVIDNMKAAHTSLQEIEWVVDDVRTLGSQGSEVFDIVIDKATMDAFQADKENDQLDDDIDAMLRQVSRVIKKDKGTFVQITWEIPYYRLHYTKRPEYAWGDNITYSFVGDSDTYRCYYYRTANSTSPTSKLVCS